MIMLHTLFTIWLFIICSGCGVVLSRRLTKSGYAPYVGACLGAILAWGVMLWNERQLDIECTHTDNHSTKFFVCGN